MEKAPLFLNRKEFLIFLGLVSIFLCFSYLLEYKKYTHLIKEPLFQTQARVLNIYDKESKKGKTYQVLKLKSDDFTFYTTRWKKIQIQKGSLVKVAIFTKNITFLSYLKGFYASSKWLRIIEQSKIDSLHVKVQSQHKESKMQELFGALFFALPVSKELRDEIAQWGISHLVAISGFHLGVLSSILYFLLKPLYRFFQDRFFPYRNSFFDLAFIVFLLLGFYVYYIDLTPSVLRAYVMGIVGFFFFSKNMQILSFSTLFFTICLVLVFFPKLLFSISFWFSVAGVYYIFLFLHHFSHLRKSAIFILLNFWVYILMMPVIHYVFDVFSFYQLFSPLLSMGFVLFYPLVLFLHLIGFGGIFDTFLTQFLASKMSIYSLHVSFWSLAFYLCVSLVAIRYRLLSLLLLFIVPILLFIENVTKF
jgi:competence protein ComEC